MPYTNLLEIALVSVVLLGLGILILQRTTKLLSNTAILRITASYLPIVITVLIIRSFIFQPFHVVSGSLKPSLEVGDIIAVNQAAYGLHLPVIHKKLFSVATPQRGDVALFYYPNNPEQVYVKRVIGLPGDKITYTQNKQIILNGEPITQELIKQEKQSVVFCEKLFGKSYLIKTSRLNKRYRDKHYTVPKGQYFMLGDNRDDSDDSRSWGFVPEPNLIGRAYRVLVSYDKVNRRPRWERMGKSLSA